MSLKKCCLAMIVLALITAVATTSASAYIIEPVPGRDGVELYIENWWDAYSIWCNPYEATWAVIYSAYIYGIDVTVSVDEVAWEIYQHTVGYFLGDPRANPMNLDLN